MKSLSPGAAETANGTCFHGYAPPPGVHDEMMDAGGRVRPHWQPFLNALDQLGMTELNRRWDEAQHLIHENGVTYNVYGDPRGLDRPWQLDPIPLLFGPHESAAVEAGLVQRARLLEAILADLHGPQRLLATGLIPPELVFANPGFLRPCHGIQPPGGRFLHLLAADLGRAADGSIWALGDRTQAPSGAGYALENRIVLSRMLPEVFHDCRVQRLALFFRTFRETLRAIAPHSRDNPRIVLLTPGPYNETYFEHAYLARYLGFTLVEGSDLTVRDNRVFLKVLGGLQPVDVIFRRLDEDYCDPLELRADSFLGVPGLVQAVRAGKVAVANALGSGLVESPALAPYLPALCRHLFGEDLRLPSVPAWWCGDPLGLDHVIANLPQMVIKAAFPATRQEPILGDRLGPHQRRHLIDQIRARPRDYVGQELWHLSTTPVLAGTGLQPRQLVMRAYLTAAEKSFTVMPGGLTRFSPSADTTVVSMQRGGGSKDTWLLSTTPVSTFSLLKPTVTPVELTRGGSDLPSRAADNLYWLGRYAERADGLTRLLRGIVVRLTEKSGLAESPELPVLLRTVTQHSQCFPGFVGPGGEARLSHPEKELRSLVYDEERSGSLASLLNVVWRAAGIVRDRISVDMWRVLNSVVGDTSPVGDHWSLATVLEHLNRTVITLSAFGGLAAESMTRGQGWRFLDMGRRLERSLYTIALVRHTLAAAVSNEGPLLEAILEIADSTMTYRRRYLNSVEPAAVLDLLLADETNPRSLAFQMLALYEDVTGLPRDAAHAGRSPEERIMLQALTSLRLADIDVLARPEPTGHRPHLNDLLTHLAADLPGLSDTITRHYLSHLQTSRHLLKGPG